MSSYGIIITIIIIIFYNKYFHNYGLKKINIIIVINKMKHVFLIFCSMFFSTSYSNQILPKLCIDCKFCKKNFITGSEFSKCSLFIREPNNDYFLVNGNKNNNIEYHYCSTARNSENKCGKEGKYYEKK